MLLTLIMILIVRTVCFWPPEFKIDLKQGEEFVIADGFDENDEDEMIKPRDLEEFHLDRDADKYFRIHKLAQGKNKPNNVNSNVVLNPTVKAKDLEDFEYGFNDPAYAGFFDQNGVMNIEDARNTYYANERVKNSVEETVRKKRLEFESVQKREPNQTDYNYDHLKAEYDAEVLKSKKRKDTLKYIEIKEDESVRESVKNIVGVDKLPTNCTREEENGIGLKAAKCFFADLNKVKTKQDRNRLGNKLGKLFLIWFMVYLTVAIPCWCHRGWCCCCFRCKFCRPRENIEEAKKFLTNNPPGVFIDNGQPLYYRPTAYEKYAQKRLEQAIMEI